MSSNAREPISPEAFRAVREALGMSVYECARYLHRAPRTVYRWEDPEYPLPPDPACHKLLELTLSQKQKKDTENV